MKLRVNTQCHVGKKMATSRDKIGDNGDEIVSCQMVLKGIRVSRESMDELAGLPLGSSSHLYDELGSPFQHMSFLLPKRELLAVGSIEHKRDSGQTVAELKLKAAVFANIRFSLDTPDDKGPQAVMSGTVGWIAAGDEIDDVRDLLTHNCYMDLTFSDSDKQMKLFRDSKPNAAQEAAAGHRAKLEAKKKAGEQLAIDTPPASGVVHVPSGAVKWSAKSAAPPVAQPGKKVSAGVVPSTAKGGVGPQFEREARELAAKKPRREPAPPHRGKR